MNITNANDTSYNGQSVNDMLMAKIARLEKEAAAGRALLADRERLVDALAWYADMENYDTSVHISADNMDRCEGAILSDFGTRARVALGKPTKGDLAALDAGQEAG